MAKSKRKKSKSKSKSKAKVRRKAKKSKRTSSARRKKAKTPARKKIAQRRSTAKRKRTARKRTEAEMSWPEVRASRLRKSAGREDRIVRDFDRSVNMTPQALEKWVGESAAGHWSAQRILEIKRKKPRDYTPDDYSHMRKVAAYVKRHAAQRPDGDVSETPWRYSLMNWGHDPLK